MPDKTDVLIVGAGISGAAIAYFLTKEGVKPLVVEKDAFGSHASGFAYGMCLPVEGVDLPSTMLPLTVEAIRLHKLLAAELKEATGIDESWRLMRCLLLSFDEADADDSKASVSVMRQRGVASGWLDAEDVRAIEPRLSPEVKGALELPETGVLEAYRHTLALVEGAERRGATFRQGEVVDVKREAGAFRARLAQGDEILADRLVLAMGPWASAAEKWLGVRCPVYPLKGQILRLDVAPAMECVVMYEGSYAGPKADGLTWAGTTEERVGFDDSTTAEARDSIIRDLLKIAPALADARVVQQTACLRPLSEDHTPIVGEAPGVPGAYLATGGGRKGILMGPVVGRMISDMILRGRTDLPTEAVSPARFAAGRRHRRAS